MKRTNCLICGSENIYPVIDLGMQPFADTFVPASHLSEPDKAYPLVCELCENCGQVQTQVATNPHDRYCSLDYSYTSSNSNFSRTHWTNYASQVSSKAGVSNDSFVVDIGSNDGFLTEQFIKLGLKAVGVDPSDYMARLAEERGVKTYTELFSTETAEKIRKEMGAANLIVANNVFNHSDQPLDFARAACALLAPNGTFVFELPYWYDSMSSGKYDQVYHEHVSYFTARSSRSLLERAGMRIFSMEVVNYHGGSLRVYAKKEEDLKEHSPDVEQFIQKETSAGLFDRNFYSEFMQKITRDKHALLKRLYDIKSLGNPIIAVGAAAKGNTFLNFHNLDSSVLDYVTDSSPHKQGKHTPLTRIPITGDEVFAKYSEPYALILSWNITTQLKEILQKINPRIQFISLS